MIRPGASFFFTQEVGNAAAHAGIREADRSWLTWLPDGAWEWRFIVVPRYRRAGLVDHSKVRLTRRRRAAGEAALSMAIRDDCPRTTGLRAPATPCTRSWLQRTDVTFADEARRGAGP